MCLMLNGNQVQIDITGCNHCTNLWNPLYLGGVLLLQQLLQVVTLMCLCARGVEAKCWCLDIHIDKSLTSTVPQSTCVESQADVDESVAIQPGSAVNIQSTLMLDQSIGCERNVVCCTIVYGEM